jgi:5-methylcytosine-specific restriction endonuclease McrA
MPIKPENRKLYPKNWKAIRAEVLERAEHKCEYCAAGNYEWGFHSGNGKWYKDIPVCAEEGGIRIILTTAHLDHDPTNNGVPNNRPNLRALCQRYYNKHDRKFRAGHARETRRCKKAVKELF